MKHRSTKPVRLQRKRTKGFHLESPNGLPVVYVGRPSKWGNPYRESKRSLLSYSLWLNTTIEGRKIFAQAEEELKGKNLACWCPLYNKDGSRFPCHADVLLSIANDMPMEELANAED